MNVCNKILITAISFISCLAVSSCSNDEPMMINVKTDPIPEHNKNTSVAWDTIVCNQLSKNQIYIGSRYLGIQNWDCNGNPPSIYLGAVFPETSFGNHFDREVNGLKNPIVAYTDFSDPFISTIENPSGAGYNKYIKDVIHSEEYKTSGTPKLDLFRVANITNLDSLDDILTDNKAFAKTICEVVKQDNNTDNIKKWTIGEIVFKGFSVTTDIPESGIFINKDISEKGLVYVRSITYGASAYFVIGSDLPFADIKSLLTSWSTSNSNESKLKDTSITVFTNSSPGQNAVVRHSLESLNTFVKNPYNKEEYGYPVYCTGCYLEDNSFFH